MREEQLNIYYYFNSVIQFKYPVDKAWIDGVIDNPSEDYKQFSIKKSNGSERIIKAPNKSLKYVQKRILNFLNTVFLPHKCSHGFVKSRSIKSNANVHLGKRYVLTYDIQDYFSSISQKEVYHTLLKLLSKRLNNWQIGLQVDSINYKKLIWIISMLTTMELKGERVLPTGSPTSPILSNMVFKKHDFHLERLAKKYNCSYSRYADDITISSNNKTDDSIRALFKEMKNYLTNSGFKINQNKTRLMPWYTHQTVNSLTVNNQEVNVPKKYIKRVEHKINIIKRYKARNRIPNGLIFTLNKKGFSVTEDKYLNFLVKTKGQIDFILSIQPNSESFLRHRGFLKSYISTYSFNQKEYDDPLGPFTTTSDPLGWDF